LYFAVYDREKRRFDEENWEVLKKIFGSGEEEVKSEKEVENLRWMKEREGYSKNFATFGISVQKEWQT
jgi:hypothetical protein